MCCRAQITIVYSNPVLVALLAWAVRGKLLSMRGWAGIAVTVLGVVVLAQPPFLFGGYQWSHTHMRGNSFCQGEILALSVPRCDL